MVCTGANNDSVPLEVEGMETFTGQIIYMQDYRTNDVFRDKTVLVIGNQSSAGDVAADASHVAKQVHGHMGYGVLKSDVWGIGVNIQHN